MRLPKIQDLISSHVTEQQFKNGLNDIVAAMGYFSEQLDASVAYADNRFKPQHLTVLAPDESKNVTFQFSQTENNLNCLDVQSNNANDLHYFLYTFKVDQSAQRISAYLKVDNVNNLESLTLHMVDKSDVFTSVNASLKDGLAFVVGQKLPENPDRVVFSVRLKSNVKVSVTDLFFCTGDYIQPLNTLQHVNSELSQVVQSNMIDERKIDYLLSANYSTEYNNNFLIHKADSVYQEGRAGLGFNCVLKNLKSNRISASVKILNNDAPIEYCQINIRKNESDSQALKVIKLEPVYKNNIWTLWAVKNAEIPADAGHARLIIAKAFSDKTLKIAQPYISLSDNILFQPHSNQLSQHLNDLDYKVVTGTKKFDFIDEGVNYSFSKISYNTVVHTAILETGASGSLGLGVRSDRTSILNNKVSSSVKFLNSSNMPHSVFLSLWSDNQFIKRIELTSQCKIPGELYTTYSIENAEIPENCTFLRLYILLNANKQVNFIEPFVSWLGGASKFTLPILSQEQQSGSNSKKSLKVLGIGNSFTLDALSYAPWILKEMGVEDVTIVMLVRSGGTIEQHVNSANSNEAVYTLVVYEPGSTKWKVTFNHSIYEALNYADFDTIIMHQQSYRSRDVTTYLPLINQLTDYIFNNINYTPKLGLMGVPAVPDGIRAGEWGVYTKTSDEFFADQIETYKTVLKQSYFEYFIPNGTAIQNARKTTLSTIGDAGNLTSEGLHLNEGIPCLIAAYACCMALRDIAGISNSSVFGSKILPTSEWLADKNVYDAYGTVNQVTLENILIAQKCAIQAFKFPFEISQI